MKLKFKVQPYQTNAVNAVIKCFNGQPLTSSQAYRLDPGRNSQASVYEEGFRNAKLALSNEQILKNIQEVQQQQNLPISQALMDFTTLNSKGKHVPVKSAGWKDTLTNCPLHLDIEMETGTGKTYCYIKTIFEMNKKYGWSKFIVVVPSIAIREGVYKSLQVTADHFSESYGKKVRCFIYNSKYLHEVESFSSNSGINVMILNIQAFNSRSNDNLRIYEALDDFQSRKPIDVIAKNRPILILDEPQKMEGTATQKALPKLNPLFILYYSATHRTQHNRIHRLDALDAYNQKLVKKIAVHGVQTRGIAGTNAYLYLEGIRTSTKAPVASIELEVQSTNGEIKRKRRLLSKGDSLFEKSKQLEQYRHYTISQIDASADTVKFLNGKVLKVGEVRGDIHESNIRRIQIRQTIKTHLEKESRLYHKGIKVLSLFFIDEVARYRDYSRADRNGEYARVFEEEYVTLRDEYLLHSTSENAEYRKYLAGIAPNDTHDGYFSKDKKGRDVNGNNNQEKDIELGEKVTVSRDTAAYDLILKNKEALLSFDEPTRFIFSHSALREGWDNPNVFVICMLKQSNNTISRRQEVGRGLRLCVNKDGERVDDPAVVHEDNVLAVVTNQTYAGFVDDLQKEISATLSARPRFATTEYFTGMQIQTDRGSANVSRAMANLIYRYLVKNDYTDEDDRITDKYHEHKASGTLAKLPKKLLPFRQQVFQLIDSVYSEHQLPTIEDGRKSKTNLLNKNFKKKEFQELWERINRKAVYRVDFNSVELIGKCVAALNSDLQITPLRFTVEIGVQRKELTDEQLQSGEGFELEETSSLPGSSARSLVRYDLIGKVAKETQLTRDTVAKILSAIKPEVFNLFTKNPEHFISEVSRLIIDQKGSMVIGHLTYDLTGERFGINIFTDDQYNQNFSRATDRLKKHVYNHAIIDSGVERTFVDKLDKSGEVVVYAKLPRGFLIPTPVGNYNPDWAISFKSGSVQHIYFVAETKGDLSSLHLRKSEKAKIDSAREFFTALITEDDPTPVRYQVVESFEMLMDLVTGK